MNRVFNLIQDSRVGCIALLLGQEKRGGGPAHLLLAQAEH